jgi:type III secretion protein V
MPGMPHLTFLIIAGAATLVGLGLKRMKGRPAEAKPASSAAPSASAQESAPPKKLDELPQAVTPLTLDLAADLTPLVEENGQAFVHVDLEKVRERIFLELGIRIPGFRVRTGAPLPTRAWALSIDEVPAGRGQLPEGVAFALAATADLAGHGIGAEAVELPGGKPVSRVTEAQRAQVEALGIPVRLPRELVAEMVSTQLKKRAPSFLGVQEVQAALSALEQQSPALVKEALQKVPLPLMTDVLKRLLQEQVSIRNLKAILDALVAPTTEGDAAQLAERCRGALARQISFQYASAGPLYAYLVDPAVEETLRQAGPAAAIDPMDAGAILEGVKRIARQGKAVLLSSPDVRRMLRRLLEGAFPEVAVLTFTELDPELQVRPVGRLSAVAAK